MLTAKAPDRSTACPVADDLFIAISSIGGSSDSELTAEAVVPCSTPSRLVVMTVTPLAKWPITSRKASGASGRSGVSWAFSAVTGAPFPTHSVETERASLYDGHPIP